MNCGPDCRGGHNTQFFVLAGVGIVPNCWDMFFFSGSALSKVRKIHTRPNLESARNVALKILDVRSYGQREIVVCEKMWKTGSTATELFPAHFQHPKYHLHNRL